MGIFMKSSAGRNDASRGAGSLPTLSEKTDEGYRSGSLAAPDEPNTVSVNEAGDREALGTLTGLPLPPPFTSHSQVLL